MPFKKTLKVQFSHPHHYFVVSEKVLIEKPRLFFVIIRIMEWSFKEAVMVEESNISPFPLET